MRVFLKDLLEKLGVHKVMGAYETNPWFLYDEDKEITVCAEVRVGPGQRDVQAELQFLYDDPSAHKKTNPDQICLLRAEATNDGLWAIKSALIKAEEYNNKIPLWDEKVCNFFLACIQSIQMGNLPDIDDLIEKELDEESTGGGRGRIGRKAPKANMSKLLGMKR